MKNAPAPSQRTDIAIVGMSALYPKANNLKSFWKIIRLGTDTISEIPDTHWSPDDYFDANQKAPDMTYCRRGGFLDPYPFDPTEFSMPPTALEATDTSQLLGLVAAKAALEDAGYGPDREFDRSTTSVILGVTGTLELVVPLGARLGHPYWKKALQESGLGPELVEEVMQRISADYVPWQENSFPGLLGNVVAGRIANRLDLHGTNCVVDAACASTLSAAHLAFLELQTGQADMVITGGTDTFNDIFMFMCFSKTPALSASGKIRPFDADSDGTMLGEGLGMVVLKRLADAERDGDKIYAVIRGVGTASDGKGGAVYAPMSHGQARALRRAYENAEVSPRTVELVEAHGTGTKVGDVVEFEGLKTVYGEVSSDKNWCAMGSVKSQIGHTKAAAGSAGLIKAALALHHKIFPPTINVTKPNPKLGIEDSAFYLNTISRPWVSHPEHPRRAGLSSFGFGGSNFHLVLEEYGAKRKETAWDGSVELAAFSAGSKDELVRKVRSALDDTRHSSLVAWESRQSFNRADAHRLVVPASADEFSGALGLALAKLEKGEPSEFYSGGDAENGKLAFLFPGQGSQYVNMGVDLACAFPELLDSLEATGRDIAHAIYPVPVFDKAEETAQSDFLTATDRAQPALGVMERGYFHLLERFGLKPEGTAGHSYGELSALYAAGVLDGEGLVELSRERGRLMASQGSDLGTMMAVKGTLDKVEQVLAESGTPVVLANRNSPDQCVLSGSAKDLEALAPELKKAGLRGVPLKVGAAFHSSFVAGARDPFHKVAGKVKFNKSEVPVYANKTAELYPANGKNARALLADQLVHQVNFVGLIEKMYADGFRTFIEVGPKTVLTGLVKAILKDKSDIKVVPMDRSAGKKSGLLDLASALAELAAAGLPVDLGAWEEKPAAEAKRRMTVPISGANYRSGTGKKPPVREPNSVGVKSAAPALPASPAVPQAASTPQLKATVTLPSGQTVPSASLPPAPPQSAPSSPSNATSSPAPSRVELRPAPISAPVPPAASVASAPAPAALDSLLPHLEALQELSRQTAQVHQQFLKSQEAAQSALGQLLAGQAAQQAAAPAASARAAAAPSASAPAPTPAPAAARTAPTPAATPARPATPAPAPAVARPTPIPAPAAPKVHTPAIASVASPVDQVLGSGVADDSVSKALLKVVADKTGYPQEMLNLEMDLEADLGIDSIKRVEILAAVEEAVPGLPKVDSDRLGALRTLGEIVTAMTPAGGLPKAAASPAATSSAAPSGAVSGALLKVVADKTGYPVEMLNLEMDLEADLGIDSIKRVEILAAVEEAVPGLPKVDSDRLGSLRTLGEIVTAMTPDGGLPPASAPAAPSSAAPSGAVSGALLKVVADKTGYPAEMLNLEMDLEADLGIDSIKRVEILAAVEEAVPGLPKVDSDRLGALRTLGEIVTAMTPAGGLPKAAASPAATSSAAPSGAVSGALLKVVADKTGYPVEMLNLEMDLEADLGIDSIKRVEILAAVEEAVPGLPKVDSDRLGSLRTLGEIVTAMTPAGGAPAPAAATPTASSHPAPPMGMGATGVARTLMYVVAEKTGYPADTLTLEMDLESDLGIDSIKRVEILASVEEAMPGLPKVDSDRLGSLHTLGEIVEAMTPAGDLQPQLTAQAAPATGVPATDPGVASALMAVVAEKTGYPVDMLTLEMDLESDLGIDSIKRVEILASVEEAMPGLPKVDADRLGSLHTLGEIVQAMTPQGIAPVPHAAVPAGREPAAGGDASGVTSALLAVVAEKTGYPADMLTLEMDLESDLGIDSIKRVEILASVEEAMPGLPKVDADRLGSLRTLGEIVVAMTPTGGAPVAAAQVAAPTATATLAAPRTISRQCLQLVDLGPGQASGLPLPEGTVLVVVEDTPGLGDDLVGALRSRGVEVQKVESGSDLPANLGVLLLVGNGGDGQRSREFLMTAFRRTREAAPALRQSGGALFTVTTLDGSFGLKGKAFDPFIGGLAGLPKTVAHEWPEVFTRAIDRHPEVTAETVLEELMKDGPVEVALSPGRRETLVTATAQASAGAPHVGKKDVVLVTGGARGVTAVCAIAAARAYGSKFVLLGRTPLEGPDFDLYPGIEDEGALKREIMQRQFGGKATPKDLQGVANKVTAQREMQGILAAFAEAGVEAVYLACDVRDRDGLQAGLAEAQKQLGPITTLIHGAGVLADRKIEDKTDEMFQSVFSTKIDSLMILNELLPDLKTMLFFSSVTARFGRPGQVDYCMANEVLNKFAQLESRRRPRCTVVAMGWGPWAGGMVTPALAREFERIGVGLIPLEAGARAVVDELSHHGAGQAEVLFGDGFPEPASPKPRHASSGEGAGGGGELLLQKQLSVAALPALDSHKLKGQPVLPMAFMMEWFAQGALQSGAGMRLVGLDELKVFRGVTLSGGVEPTLAVSVVSTSLVEGRQHWTLELKDTGRNVLHARATVVLGDSQDASPALADLAPLSSRGYSHSPEAIYSELLFHGPDFHAVTEVEGISTHGLVAGLRSAGKPAEWEREPLRSDWATEPLVVDGVLQLGILWCWDGLGKPSLPNGFAHYRQFVNRFPKSGVKAALRVVSHSERALVADCDLIDAKGSLLARFERLEWTADDALKGAFGLSGALAR